MIELNRKYRKFVFYEILIAAFVCNFVIADSNGGIDISGRHSGYGSDVPAWSDFMQCWKENIRNIETKDKNSLLRFSGIDPAVDRSMVEKLRESALSKSFIDFHIAYIESGGVYWQEGVNDNIGIFSPEKIQSFKNYNTQLFKIKNEFPIESSDQDYFKYGLDQDNATGRISYLKNALVVGQYGFSDYEVIVLYSDSKTLDGELESAIFSHAYIISAYTEVFPILPG